MHTHSRSLSRLRSHLIAVAVAIATVALAVGPERAHAAPVTWTDPGGSGAKVTLDQDAVAAGGRVQISGTGFVRGTGSGSPWIAVKPDDRDLTWTSGGADAIPGDPGEAPIWFQARADGSFSGWIDVPADTPRTGPGTGANAGKHWFRILSGAFSSDGSSATTPITFEAFFAVADRIQVGALSTAGVFYAGGHVTQGGVVTFRGAALPPDAAVGVTLDGTALPTTATTDAAGAIVTTGAPAPNRVTIPAATPSGAHTLTFAVGAATVAVPITVHVPASAAVATPRVRPGGLVAFSLRDFVGVAGGGQKVAVTLGTSTTAPVIACVQTDATGAARGTVRLPADAAGDQQLRFPAGSSCVVGGAQDDLPGRPPVGSLAPVVVAATDAPAVAVAAPAVRGGRARVTGEDLPAGASVVPELDGSPIGDAIAVGPDGRFATELALPAGLALGPHVLVVSGPGAGAATTFDATDPVPQQDPPIAPPTGPAPAPDPTSPGAPPGPVPAGPPAGTAPTPAPATPTPPRLRSLRVAGTALRLSLAGQRGRSVRVTVRSAGRVRTASGGRARVVTFASATVTRTGTVSVRLTKDGRAALRRLRRVRVVVRLAPKGGKAVTRTVTLRR